jgi:spoIIIJ-associated protein
MEWVETTGKTIDEAREAALDQLGVDESDAEFVVVSEPKAGLFGRMRGEARVRARVRPTAPRPKRGRSRRSGEESRRQGGTRGARGGRSGEGGSKRGEQAATAVVDGDEDDAAAGANGSTAGPAAGAAGTGTGTRKRRRRGGRGRSGGSNGSGGTGAAAGGSDGGTRPQRSNGNGAAGRPRQDNKGNEEETVEQVLSLEEQGESARRFVEGVVREMGLTAEVGVRLVDEDTAEVTVGGDELGLLIGPGGATLSALQEITRTVVQRHTGGHSDRIIVDVAGYRAKRAEALAKFAAKVVDEVIVAGEERALEPMSPADRKVVHDTVNEIDGVSTRSEGEEPRRYIVISPTQAAAPAAAAESTASTED